MVLIQGILLRGGEVLDSLSTCDTIAFDKTGTLTTGELVCKAIEPLRGHSVQGQNNTADGSCCSPSCDKEALAVAAAMEKGASHPIAVYVHATLLAAIFVLKQLSARTLWTFSDFYLPVGTVQFQSTAKGKIYLLLMSKTSNPSLGRD